MKMSQVFKFLIRVQKLQIFSFTFRDVKKQELNILSLLFIVVIGNISVTNSFCLGKKSFSKS